MSKIVKTVVIIFLVVLIIGIVLYLIKKNSQPAERPRAILDANAQPVKDETGAIATTAVAANPFRGARS